MTQELTPLEKLAAGLGIKDVESFKRYLRLAPIPHVVDPVTGRGVLDKVLLKRSLRETDGAYEAFEKILKLARDFPIYLSYGQAHSCCGAAVFGGVPNGMKSDYITGIAKALYDSAYRHYTYYSINKEVTQIFQDLGFTHTDTFVNKNTSRSIDVLSINLDPHR